MDHGATTVFSPNFNQLLNSKLNNLLIESDDKDYDKSVEVKKDVASKKFSCSCCRMDFADVEAQREHFKLDSHVSKLKEFTENREESNQTTFNRRYATPQGKMFLQNEAGQIFSIYKCLVFNKKDPYDGNVLVQSLRDCCVENQRWTVLLLGGGHFAGAVFEGTKAVVHKCFHFYTVRKGQGGAQSTEDNSSGTSQPKSAGATLRRYNERALSMSVRQTLTQWQAYIDNSSLIFYSASGALNKSILFGGTNSVLDRTNPRIRKLPIPIRKATFKEILRVHQLLYSLKVFENAEKGLEEVSKYKILEKKINETKDPVLKQELETSVEASICAIDDESPSEDSEEESDEEIEEKEEIATKATHEKKKKKKKKKTNNLSKEKQQLAQILRTGDINKLTEFLENLGNCEQNETNTEEYKLLNITSDRLDEDGNFAIHIAANGGHVDLVKFLLENDCDPSKVNNNHQTPYSITDNKDIRTVMKEFAKENPSKYNYNKAHIPVNHLSQEEIDEKKKLQRIRKKEKMKLKKEEKKSKVAEEAEKARFLQLSDREKMALAAERRILTQNGKVVSRCYQCAADITGKVPFEYLQNRFCTMDCLKAHRMKNLLT